MSLDSSIGEQPFGGSNSSGHLSQNIGQALNEPQPIQEEDQQNGSSSNESRREERKPPEEEEKVPLPAMPNRGWQDVVMGVIPRGNNRHLLEEQKEYIQRHQSSLVMSSNSSLPGHNPHSIGSKDSGPIAIARGSGDIHGSYQIG